MRVITIGSGKGGVGRSVFTANLGVVLAKKGKSTLVIDGSVTSPSQALFFNLEKVSKTLNGALEGEFHYEEAVHEGPGGVNVLPASVTLDKIRGAKVSRIVDLVQNHVEGYDYVLIDASNGLRKETIASFKAGEELLVLTIPEMTAVSDSMKTKVSSGFLGLDPIGVVINKVKGEEHELPKDEIERIMNIPVLSEIPFDENVRKSINEGQLLVEWKPDSPAAKKIVEFADYLIEEE